jgi:putative nucleotidyltransferase with HDIG domain
MNIECSNCKTNYRLKDGIIPAGRKINFICKNCRPNNGSEISKSCLEKPIGSNTKYPAIESTRIDDSKMYEKEVGLKQKIISSIKGLPAMPQVVLEIQNLLSTTDLSIKKISDLVETDQSITTKVLKIANSAYYGMSSKISTIQQASRVLGLMGLSEVVTMAGTERLLGGKLPGYGYDSDNLWKHSLAVAYGSKVLANLLDPGVSHTAHIAGLIHDAGKIILDRFVSEKKTEINTFMETEQKTFTDAEIKFFGFNHADVASEICKKWKFPDIMSYAIKWHHAPSRSNKDLLSYILHMSDYLATLSIIGYDEDELLYQLEEGTMDFLKIKQTDVSRLVAKITDAVNKIAYTESEGQLKN